MLDGPKWRTNIALLIQTLLTLWKYFRHLPCQWFDLEGCFHYFHQCCMQKEKSHIWPMAQKWADKIHTGTSDWPVTEPPMYLSAQCFWKAMAKSRAHIKHVGKAIIKTINCSRRLMNILPYFNLDCLRLCKHLLT